MNKYSVAWLLAIVKKMNNNNMPGFDLMANLLFQWTQTRAEQHQAAIRAGLLKMDLHLRNLLAFSGKSE